MFDIEELQPLADQLKEGASSPSSVMAADSSSGPLEPAPPAPPDETNEQRARRLAKKHGVDPNLIVSMMAQESRGKTKAKSWKDARGPMQLMPETARGLGVTDIYDPEQNIEAGVKYYKQMLDRYKDPKKAIAAYNMGPKDSVLNSPDWWARISKYSNTKGITGTSMSNPARGLHDPGSTGNYVKNIWSNYMKGGAQTVMNYAISDETVKLAKKLFGAGAANKKTVANTNTSGKPLLDPSEVGAVQNNQPQGIEISDETSLLARQLFGGSEYDQYLAQTGQVANPSGQTEYDGLPPIGGGKSTTKSTKTKQVTKEPTLADVNKSLKAEGKKPITQEQLTKQAKENESFGSDVTVGYSGGTPVDDSGAPLPVPIDGPIEVKTDEDILANGTRTIKMDPDTDKDQAFDNALHSIGAEYGLPSSQVDGFIAKRRAEGKTVQYDLTTEERAALKASGKQMGVTVDYGTINNLLNFGRTEPDKIHPKLRQTVDMYTAENRAPKIDLNLPEMNEPKGFINKLRGISPEQERTENMQSDPLYQQAKDNLYREKGFEPNRTLEGSYDLLGAPALDEREIQDEYMRLQSTEKLLDEEAIRRGQERGDTMGASEGGWAGSFSAGLNTSAGLVQVLNQLGGGGAENNVTRYLRRLGKETGAAASVESEKNTGGWDTVNRFITGLPIGLTKAMMLVPTANGSTSIAFGIEAGLGESGRGGTGTDVLRESGKGYLMGTLFPVGRKLGSIAGGGKAGALVDIGTVTAGTAAISGAGGASPEEAGKAGIENAILDVLMRVARMRKSGGKWYDSGEADLDSVKNKIYRYTPNPREIGIVDGGLTRAANIAGVPENHVYFTVKADGSVVVINQPPPKTKVTYIKKAPTQAELESMLRKQVEALGKETTQPSQAGPAMSEPIRSVVPIPGSEPRVVNAEPIPKIVMGGKADPIPESQTAIDAQTAAAADPSQTKRIAVMFPKGTKPQHDPATQWKIVNSKGDVIVVDKEGWKAKAAELGVKPTKSALVEYTKAGKNEVAVQDLLGRPESAVVESTEATPGRAAVEVTQDGTQIDATVVDTEQAAAETVDSMEQQYPDATVEVRDSTEVAENRLADTADTGLSPVDRFEQQAGRSATSAELGQILEGKTPEEILGLGEITAVADHTPVTFLVPKKVTIGGRDAMEVLMEIPQPGTSAASAVLKAARDGSKTPIDDAIAEMEAGKAKVAGTSFADTVGQYDQAIAGLRKLKNKDIVVDDGPQAGVTRVVRVKANRPPEPTEFTDWANDPNTIDVEVNREPVKVEPVEDTSVEPAPPVESKLAPTGTDKNGNPKTVIHERPGDGEYPVHRVTIDGQDRFIQRMDTQDLGTNWHEVERSESGSWYPPDMNKGGTAGLLANNLGSNKTEAIEALADKYTKPEIDSSESPKAEDVPDTRDPMHVQSDADLAEYMATRTVSDEPHVGMLKAGVEVQLETYVRPATNSEGKPILRNGQPLLEGSLVQTKTSNGESSYVGDRILGTDRADILRKVDNRRLEYQAEHGQEGTFIPKSEVAEKVEQEPAGPMKEGDDVITPDGPGEFIRTSGKKSVVVEVGGEEKTYLASLVKPDNGEAGAVSIDLITGGVRPFVKDDLMPAVSSLVEGLRSTRDDMKKLLFPAGRGNIARDTANFLRGLLGGARRNFDIAEKALWNTRRHLQSKTTDQKYDFIDAIESGDLSRLPTEEAPMATEIRRLLDEARSRVIDLNTGALSTFYENYFPHIWKNPSDSAVAGILSKKPFEGTKSFLKQRTYSTFRDGLDAGLIPISDNPIDLVLMKIKEMERFIVARTTLEKMKDVGLARFVRPGGDIPAGFVKINDKIADVNYRLETGQMVIGGKYYAQEQAAQIINNHLSPGLKDHGRLGSAAFRGWRYAANLLNQAQLGLSAFHLGFTSLDATISRASLGVYQLSQGHPIEAIKSFASTPVAAITNAIKGNKAYNEWMTPMSTDLETQKIIAFMEQAGGAVKMDDFFHTRAARKFIDAAQAGNIIGAALRAPAAVLDATSMPIMEYVVPRQKLGVFYDLMRFEIKRLGPGATQADLQNAASKIWDSVDNRMGQLVYDNLFWHNSFKDLAMASVRSVGWNLGTMREVGGGLKDATPRQMYKRYKEGDPSNPAFSYRMSYVAALTPVVALTGAITQYLFTGQLPNNGKTDDVGASLKDMFYPRTGNLDDKGRPERLSIPSYVKDIVGYYKHPVTTLTHKIHPLANLIAEGWQNEDFYGTQIRNPDDPVVQQLLDSAKFVGESFLPFGIRNLQKENKRGGSTAVKVAGFIGFPVAPNYVNASDAEELLGEMMNSAIPNKAKTKEDQIKIDTKVDLARARAHGQDVYQEFRKAVDAGILKPDDWAGIVDRSKPDYLARQAKGRSLEEIQKLMDVANPSEREQLEPVLREKEASAAASTVSSQKKLKELDAVQLHENGDDTLFNKLSESDRKRIESQEELMAVDDSLPQYKGKSNLEKVELFKRSPIEDQAGFVAFLRKAKATLDKKKVPSKTKVPKKPMTQEEKDLLANINSALTQYNQERGALPVDKQNELVKKESDVKKTLPKPAVKHKSHH